MFAAIALLSVLFTVMGAVGMVWSVVLVWFLLLGVAHVVANAWGTRAGRQVVEGKPMAPDGPPRPRSELTIIDRFGDDTRLRQSTRLGWPMMVVTCTGALAGGALASIALLMLSLERVGYAGVVVGTVSAAAVGGFLAFLTSSFVEVAGGAWQQAVHGAAPPKQGSR